MRVTQDGNDFYDADTMCLLIYKSDKVKDDFDLDGAEEARKEFLQWTKTVVFAGPND